MLRSSWSTASLLIATPITSFFPFIVTFTAPPPAVPSTSRP